MIIKFVAGIENIEKKIIVVEIPNRKDEKTRKDGLEHPRVVIREDSLESNPTHTS